MPTQAFPFSGQVNYDDPDEVMPAIHHRDPRNIVFMGTAPNLQVRNMPGTREKTNPFLINDGNNLTIGRYYDPIGKKIFTFNYRGDDNKAIYMYDTLATIWYRLVEGGINADTDVLGFTDTGIIYNIDIIYGDSTQGDILCFTDSYGVPKKLNIQRAINGDYGTIQKSYLDIAKEPADIPPYTVYEDDVASTVNNLRKKLFKIKIRWSFDDQDKSVTGSQGELCLPASAFDQQTDTDPTKNCRIAVTYQTGPANVKKIELLAAVSLGNVFSDYFLITSIDKSVENVPDNDIATYLFYNNQAYNYIDVEESNQLFDYVPQVAGAQTIINGNVLTYGKITEGYDNLTNFSNGATTSNLTSSQTVFYSGIYFTRLITNQGGKSGFGSGNIHIVVRGLVPSPSFSLDTYTIYMTDASTVTYTLLVGDDAAAVIEGLRIDALSKGYTIISAGDNDLYIFKIGISLARTFITSNYLYNSITNTSLMAYDWSSKRGFGLVYLDQKGRTNGAVYTSGFSVSSIAYAEQDSSVPYIPKFSASIYHQPPDWAYYVQWVRTKDLSKSKIQQWISDRTFKDTVAISGVIKYAYVSIESLNAFVATNPGSPLGYAFIAGDRIKFMKRINADNTTANIYGDTKDYEIVASLVDPIINGETKSGQFVKLILPSTDGNFNFGTDGFANYLIELYTPAQSVANNLDVYYEYGERYAIGNPTLSTRFHQGMLQNQTTNYATPATYEFFKGDFYIKLRAVQVGNVYTFNILNGTLTAGRFLFGLNFAGSTYTDSNITAQSVSLANISGNTPSGGITPSSDTRWFLKAILNTTFHIKGTIIINFTTNISGDTWRIFTLNRFNERMYLVTFDASTAGTYTFSIDTYITLEDDRIFLIAEGGERPVTILSSNITFTIDHVISQKMIDQNFSDYFPSSVNSNGRAFIYDPNAAKTTFPVMYRWSLAYQADTNINQANRFYPQNLDNVDRRFGAIQRMATWDRLLTFFQERKCGQTGVYQKFISDSAGSQQLITTTSIITENNVQYYAGNFGVGNQPDSVVQSGYVYYFADPIKGKLLRLSRDGITDLSELYKTQTWAGENIPPYLTSRNYTFGGFSRITGTFNIRKNNTGEYLCVLQPWTLGEDSFAGETMAFDEGRNAFTSPYDFAPEQIICAENVLYSFKNGKMYIHDDTDNYNTFYGQYFDPEITRVYNGNLIEKKSFLSVTEVASSIWDCPEITTNSMSYGSTPQQSNLITQDFENFESNFSAAFLGDIYSVNGLQGDSLKGNLIKIKFRAPNATNLVTLSAVNLYYINSPLTNR